MVREQLARHSEYVDVALSRVEHQVIWTRAVVEHEVTRFHHRHATVLAHRTTALAQDQHQVAVLDILADTFWCAADVYGVRPQVREVHSAQSTEFDVTEDSLIRRWNAVEVRVHLSSEDYLLPYPAWVARMKPSVTQVVTGYFGLQYRGDPGHHELAHYVDGAGVDTLIAIAYWDDASSFRRWQATPSLS